MLPYHQGTKDTKKHEGVRPEAARTRVYLFVSLGALCVFVVRFPVALRPLSPCGLVRLSPAENGWRVRNAFCGRRLRLRRVPGTGVPSVPSGEWRVVSDRTSPQRTQPALPVRRSHRRSRERGRREGHEERTAACHAVAVRRRRAPTSSANTRCPRNSRHHDSCDSRHTP